MSKKSKTPAAPDPAATAAAQTAQNKETAITNAYLGNIDQYTPYGNVKYTTVGTNPDGTPKFQSTVSLSDAQQKLLDSQNANELALQNMGTAQLGRINQSVSTPFSYVGLPEVFNDGGNAAKAGTDALLSRLNPKFDQDEEALRTRLINQGIGQGSDAYAREFNTFNQAKNDARQQAVIGGQQYANALTNDSITRRNQAINEYTTQRNAPLNEYNALVSGTQIQNPTFGNGNNGTNVAGTDISGLINQNYANQVSLANANQAGRNNLTSSLFGLGGAIAGGFAGSPAGGAAIANSLFR